jgi:hypothetical protein
MDEARWLAGWDVWRRSIQPLAAVGEAGSTAPNCLRVDHHHRMDGDDYRASWRAFRAILHGVPFVVLDDLDALLHKAAAADAATRMEFRDRIAAFGSEAIKRLEPWVYDPRLGAFAVRTIERAAAMPGAAAVAKVTLQKANATGRTRDDVVSALARLRAQARRSASTGSRPGRPGDTKRSRTKDEVFVTCAISWPRMRAAASSWPTAKPA